MFLLFSVSPFRAIIFCPPPSSLFISFFLSPLFLNVLLFLLFLFSPSLYENMSQSCLSCLVTKVTLLIVSLCSPPSTLTNHPWPGPIADLSHWPNSAPVKQCLPQRLILPRTFSLLVFLQAKHFKTIVLGFLCDGSKVVHVGECKDIYYLSNSRSLCVFLLTRPLPPLQATLCKTNFFHNYWKSCNFLMGIVM